MAYFVLVAVSGAVCCLYIAIKGLRWWVQGQTKGSDIQKSLKGLTYVITGANTGIGKATALELSKKGARVIMLCRNLERANKAAKEMTDITKNEFIVKQLDLSSLNSVRKCCKDLLQSEERIDCLINNAGIFGHADAKTEDGFEIHFGTNHLGHFLLTELLMPLLLNSARTGFNSRIVIVSGLAHKWSKIFWDDVNLNRTGNYSLFQVYGQSKCANIMHGAELARRLKGTGITVYSVHPGVVATEVQRHIESRYRLLKKLRPLVVPFMRTPFHGCQTILYCALEDQLKDESGKFYADFKEVLPAPHIRSEADQKRLWALSEELVKL